ncbi:hypothetical protein GCM10009760_23220 [Kitasatospora kazusensis]|uniref:Uncharacterized protein n=1 Tax=Kitasatospora kazusensis TaxID=407974 RepID=A0ABN2ZCR4_9ACTN
MSTVHITAPPAAATNPRVRAPKTITRTAGGSTAVPTDTPRLGPLARVVRNTGIVLDTAARVVFLGRDGVRL